jgi:quinol monooxygenase YgiN
MPEYGKTDDGSAQGNGEFKMMDSSASIAAPGPVRRAPRWLCAMLMAAALIVPGSGSYAQMTEPKPIVRLAELDIDPTQLGPYRTLLREEIDTSIRVEPGVLMLYAVAIRGTPNHIRLMEVYADQAAYEAHIASPHFRKYKVGTAKMVRSLTLLETDPISLGAKQTTGSSPR